jgi:UDP-glucuronate 4-epimerase
VARYLVTGVAGFIAARVTEMLLEAGHSVVGLDDMNSSYDVRMKDHRLKNLEGQKDFEFKKLDISDRSAIDGLDADPWVYVDANVNGTLNLLEFARKNEIPKFILASTSSIYGTDAPLPTPETADSSRPLQPYAATKKGAEAMCHAYHFLHGIDVTVVRYFTVYGPAGRPTMSMFRFVQKISEGKPMQLFGDGEQTRGFTYIDDIARGTILALAPVGYEIINLGGHESVSMNNLIQMLEEAIGRKAVIEVGPADKADMLASWADVTKAGEMLGWEPNVGLKQGIANTVAWYKAERAWASQISTD